MQRGSKLKEYVEERGVFTLQVLGSLELLMGPLFLCLSNLALFQKRKCQKMKKKTFLQWPALACLAPPALSPGSKDLFYFFKIAILSCRCHICSRATTEHICKSSNLILCVHCAICFCNGDFVEKARQS